MHKNQLRNTGHTAAAAKPASHPTPKNPIWQKSERFERIGRFSLEASAADIFPLLCPVLEYKWYPEWACTMCYSDSGVAEPNAVFHTHEPHGKTIVWTVITYRPHSLIEFLVVDGTEGVNRFSISLEEKEDYTTELTWGMLFTSTTSAAAKTLRRTFTEEFFRRMLEGRRTEMAYYLKTGQMLPKNK